MKVILTIMFSLAYNLSSGQEISIKLGKRWCLYDIVSPDIFKYSVDTLKNFPFYAMDEDSVHLYMVDLGELPADDPPFWMGSPHVASYEVDGVIRKVDISLYGGFFYDEVSKRYFQISEDKVEKWLSYVRECFMAIHKQQQ